MSYITFENYSKIALENFSDTVVSGRYSFQEDQERSIVPDVIQKLQIESSDRLLEIGCGSGNILLPLSYLVKQAVGIDNENAIKRLEKKDPEKKISTYVGNFLNISIHEKFNKILIYSVIQYMSSLSEMEVFLRKAFSLLHANGKILIGDLPNEDKKRRYEETHDFKQNSNAWRKLVEESGGHEGFARLPKDNELLKMNDATYFAILEIARKAGFESYLLPQSKTLPFGLTRDDILIIS